MRITNSIQYKRELLERFKALTDEQLISEFNNKAGKKYFNFYIQGFMCAIADEFERRKIDFSEIGDVKQMSYASLIEMVNGKVQIAETNKSKNEIQ